MEGISLISFALLLAVSVVTVSAEAGRSACRELEEIGQTYPHHFDPAKYWYCETLNEPAEEKDCLKGMAYMHLLKECIPWANWQWKPLQDPPSVA
ncbi:uncharacterized protein LOC128859212 isoform X2 [Anastrepha ludens]|uniref:uncharacterized protein LOC128859212 isoform X2 n=1 Tax=Anastrepha ludens TaxID=28586 RepID=UPI0023B20155|nr:uncharacterized protein LOC128859212 isoform X2 [Anastrepha ludens]